MITVILLFQQPLRSSFRQHCFGALDLNYSRNNTFLRILGEDGDGEEEKRREEKREEEEI